MDNNTLLGGIKVNHSGTVEIETTRLLLRRFVPLDAAKMYQNWASDDEVTRYLTWEPHQNVFMTLCVLYEWIHHYKDMTYYQWGIEYQGELIGSIGVYNVQNTRAEIGYCLSRAYWGRNIMTEAVQGVIAHLFNCGFSELTARFQVENKASGRVMEKCGMTYVDTCDFSNENEPEKTYQCAVYHIVNQG